MASFLKNEGNLLEPSVGTGNLINNLDGTKYSEMDVFEIKKEYLNQINIINANKFNEDFLKYNFNTKYNNIITNPPYIKIQDLDDDYIKFIKSTWHILNYGNIDIYQA